MNLVTLRRLSVAGVTIAVAFGLAGYRQRSVAAKGLPRISMMAQAATTPATQPTVETCMEADDSSQAGADNRAWCLWRALIDDNGAPVWETWSPDPMGGMSNFVCPSPIPTPAPGALNLQVREAHGVQASKGLIFANALTIPRQVLTQQGLSPHDGPPVQGPTTADSFPETAETLYNPAATKLICEQIAPPGNPAKKKLVDRLNQMVSSPYSSTTAMAPYPVIVKTFWAQVPATGNNARFSVWDPQEPPPQDPRNMQTWTSKVNIDYGQNVCNFQPPAPGGYTPFGTKTALSCFHSVFVSQADLVASRDIRTNTLGAASGVVIDRNSDSQFALLGFHIAAKGPKGWRWQTYYWSADGFRNGTADAAKVSGLMSSPYAPPASASPKLTAWTHYVMDTRSAPNPTGALTNSTSALANPYLEATLKDGASSSCFRCHSGARFYPTDAAHNQDTCFKWGQDRGGSGDDPPKGACSSTAGSSPTDQIWSIADANVTTFTGEGGPAANPINRRVRRQAAAHPR